MVASETAGSARRVGSCRGGPGRWRLLRALVRAAARRSHPARLLGRRSGPLLCGHALVVTAPHQALALPVRPLGVLLRDRWHARRGAVAPVCTQPPQEPALQQLGVEPVGFRPAMLPRYRDTRRMDHVRLYSTCLEPARQPKPSRPASKASAIRVIV